MKFLDQFRKKTPRGRMITEAKPNAPRLTVLHIDNLESFAHQYPAVPEPETVLSPLLLTARWIAGELRAEQMPDLAAELLEAGFDSRHLRMLAGELNVGCRADIENLVLLAFKELRFPTSLSEKQAAYIYVRQLAREVIAGKRDPERAGKDIAWSMRHLLTDQRMLRLNVLTDEYSWDQDAQRYRTLITKELIEALADLGKVTDEEIFSLAD